MPCFRSLLLRLSARNMTVNAGRAIAQNNTSARVPRCKNCAVVISDQSARVPVSGSALHAFRAGAAAVQPEERLPFCPA